MLTYMPKKCQMCGEEYTPVSGSQKYCPKCRVELKKRKDENHHKREKTKWEERDQTCACCGKTFRWPRRAKRCPDCRAKPVAWSIRKMAANEREMLDDKSMSVVKTGEERAYTREDGVIVIPAKHADTERKHPKKPKPGTDPKSMEAVLYELDQLNQQRAKNGQPELSYGQFVIGKT